jgi:hypothetical protein
MAIWYFWQKIQSDSTDAEKLANGDEFSKRGGFG